MPKTKFGTGSEVYKEIALGMLARAEEEANHPDQYYPGFSQAAGFRLVASMIRNIGVAIVYAILSTKPDTREEVEIEP